MKDIKRGLMTYSGHEINENTLEVTYIIGSNKDFGYKDFDLQKYEDWVKDEYAELNDGEYVVWLNEGNPISPEQDVFTYTVTLSDYMQENETELVSIFFDENKG